MHLRVWGLSGIPRTDSPALRHIAHTSRVDACRCWASRSAVVVSCWAASQKLLGSCLGLSFTLIYSHPPRGGDSRAVQTTPNGHMRGSTPQYCHERASVLRGEQLSTGETTAARSSRHPSQTPRETLKEDPQPPTTPN